MSADKAVIDREVLEEGMLNALKREEIAKVPLWKNMFIRYGFGSIAMILAIIVAIWGPAPEFDGFFIAFVLSITHLIYREKFCKTLDPDSRISQYEFDESEPPLNNSELQFIGRSKNPVTWQEVYQEGFRYSLLGEFESKISIFWSVLGYGTLIIAGFL